MKFSSKIFFGLALLALGAPAFAAEPVLPKACKTDLERLGCGTAATDKEAWFCLEKNEKHGEKYGGFSHRCHKAHEKFEKALSKKDPHAEKDERAPASQKR